MEKETAPDIKGLDILPKIGKITVALLGLPERAVYDTTYSETEAEEKSS